MKELGREVLEKKCSYKTFEILELFWAMGVFKNILEKKHEIYKSFVATFYIFSLPH